MNQSKRVGGIACVLAALAAYGVVASCRARRAHDSGPLAVAEIAERVRDARPVIFVGLDGADWQLIDRYTASGAMPNLARLVAEGAGGALETIHPPLSPIVWTTMMTGVSPVEHRILDFTRFSPADGQKEPITSDERRAPAIWNMAGYAGRTSATFGLWATYPAERVFGVVVSDRMMGFLFAEERTPARSVFPADRESWASATLASVEKATGYAAVHAYLPWLGEAEYQKIESGGKASLCASGLALRRVDRASSTTASRRIGSRRSGRIWRSSTSRAPIASATCSRPSPHPARRASQSRNTSATTRFRSATSGASTRSSATTGGWPRSAVPC
jgi:hypothetical protein